MLNPITEIWGGNVSHEFMLVHEIGEDTIYTCDCGYRANKETMKDNTKICPCCQKEMTECRGVEIGNIFQLGDKYSKSMKLEYMTAKGELKNPIMGCYGIGIGRAFASVLEESTDDFGPIFNIETAPFTVEVIGLQDKNEAILELSQKIYHTLMAENIDTLLDNRDVRAGEKFADADLIAAPVRIIVSQKNLTNGVLEIKYRVNNKDVGRFKTKIPVEKFAEEIKQIINGLK